MSQEFLRFAEFSLSNGKADSGHYPSFKSCQIRVPNSINKKCLENREKRLSGNVKVKTIQRWNGIRAQISREFIEDFRTYLEGKISEQELDNELLVNNHKQNQNKYDNDNIIDWIEKLWLIGIEDHRKKAIDIIFVPYFILVKKLSNEETISKINEWLDRCNSIRTLDFDTKYRINTAIKSTNKKQILPMKYKTLKNNYQYLYSLIQNNKGESSIMISSSSIHNTIFNNNNKKIIDYVKEEDEFVNPKDITKIDAELIKELEELYLDDETDEEF